MGRAIRHVPANWDHPRDERGEYIPLHTHFPYSEDEIKEGLADGWLDASKPHYGIGVMPEWSESEKTHIQLYETTTEGTPISPVFDSLDDLCAYAAEHCTTFASWKATAASGGRCWVRVSSTTAKVTPSSCRESPTMTPLDTNANRVALVAGDAIDLYVEYLTVHGYPEDRARYQAICDMIEGATAVIEERREPGGVSDLETLPL